MGRFTIWRIPDSSRVPVFSKKKKKLGLEERFKRGDFTPYSGGLPIVSRFANFPFEMSSPGPQSGRVPGQGAEGNQARGVLPGRACQKGSRSGRFFCPYAFWNCWNILGELPHCVIPTGGSPPDVHLVLFLLDFCFRGRKNEVLLPKGGAGSIG